MTSITTTPLTDSKLPWYIDYRTLQPEPVNVNDVCTWLRTVFANESLHAFLDKCQAANVTPADWFWLLKTTKLQAPRSAMWLFTADLLLGVACSRQNTADRVFSCFCVAYGDLYSELCQGATGDAIQMAMLFAKLFPKHFQIQHAFLVQFALLHHPECVDRRVCLPFLCRSTFRPVAKAVTVDAVVDPYLNNDAVDTTPRFVSITKTTTVMSEVRKRKFEQLDDNDDTKTPQRLQPSMSLSLNVTTVEVVVASETPTKRRCVDPFDSPSKGRVMLHRTPERTKLTRSTAGTMKPRNLFAEEPAFPQLSTSYVDFPPTLQQRVLD